MIDQEWLSTHILPHVKDGGICLGHVVLNESHDGTRYGDCTLCGQQDMLLCYFCESAFPAPPSQRRGTGRVRRAMGRITRHLRHEARCLGILPCDELIVEHTDELAGALDELNQQVMQAGNAIVQAAGV